MKLVSAFRLAVAETRRSRGRLAFSVLSISIGVFSLTAIRTTLISIEDNIANEARSLMGADLTLDSPRPFGAAADALDADLRHAGAERSEMVEFYSMLYEAESAESGDGAVRGRREGSGGRAGRAEGAGEASTSNKADRNIRSPENATRLVRVRAISGRFPLVGQIETDPPDRWRHFTESASPLIIPDRDLLDFLDLKRGATLLLGRQPFHLEATFVKRPGSPASGFGFAPAVYIHMRHLQATGLIQTGSRLQYHRTYLLPEGFPIEEWKKQHWDEAIAGDITIKTYRESAEGLQRFLLRLSHFLTAVGLITLLMGGLGIGATINVFMKDRLDHAAIFRSLGATPGQVFRVYFVLAFALGLIGSVMGLVPGVVLPLFLSDYASAQVGTLLPVSLEIHFSWIACVDSALSGLGASLLFTLLPLYRIRNASPLRVLRHMDDTEARFGNPSGRIWQILQMLLQMDTPTVADALVHLLVLSAVFAFILIVTVTHTGSIFTALLFTGAIAIALILLHVTSRLVIAATRLAIPRVKNFHLRQAISNLHRPGNQTAAVLTATGIGMLLLATIFILEASIQTEISLENRADTPNLFLIDIQSSQKHDVERVMADAGMTSITMSPMIQARIQAINNRPVEKKITEQDAARRTWEDSLRTREYFVSFRDHLLDSEQLTRGQLWAGAPREQEVSVEGSWADTMKIDLGDRLTLDVQGLPLSARVTSFRKIRWQAMRPNAILLLSPGRIESAPRMYVASARYADRAALAQLKRRLVRQHPNISMIDAMEAVENVRFILDRISIIVRFLATVTLFNGFLILAGAIAASRFARLREAMLLRVLGATSRDVLRILVFEYALLALLGSLTGSILAEAINRPLVSYLFDSPTTVPYVNIALLLAGIVGLNTAMGLLISRDVGRTSPMNILREE